MAYPIKTERELLDRIAYKGPEPGPGQAVTRTYDWSGAVTDAAIWTPESGNRFIVSLISINTTAECTITIFDEDDSEVNRLYKGIIQTKNTIVIPYPIPRVSSDIDRSLSITTSATGGYLTVYGWETGYGELSTTTSVTTSSSSSSSTSSSTISISTSSSSSSSSTSQTTSSSSSSSSTSQTTSSSSSSSTSQTTSSSSSSSTSQTTSSTSSSTVSISTSSITQSFT